MDILGIDPNTKMPAYCIIDEKGKIIKYGKITLYPIKGWEWLIKRVDIVAIEGQFLGPSPHSLFKLSFCAGEISGLSKYFGKKVMIINPKTWQNKMLKVKFGAKRKEIKHISKVIASSLVNERINDSDIADAILIAEYARQKVNNEGIKNV